jgi:hypothetical protein
MLLTAGYLLSYWFILAQFVGAEGDELFELDSIILRSSVPRKIPP